MYVFQGVSGKLTELDVNFNQFMSNKTYLGYNYLIATNAVGSGLGVMTKSYGKMVSAECLSESVESIFASLLVFYVSFNNS